MSENTTVQIDPTWSISWDGGHNWLLQRTVTRTTTDKKRQYEDTETIAYYSDLGACARRLLHERLSKKGAQTAGEIVNAVRQAREDVTQAIGEASGWPQAPAPEERW